MSASDMTASETLAAMDPLGDRWAEFVKAEPEYLAQFTKHAKADGTVHEGSGTSLCVQCMGGYLLGLPPERLIGYLVHAEAEATRYRLLLQHRELVDAIMARAEEGRERLAADAVDMAGNPIRVGDKVCASDALADRLRTGRDADRMPAEIGEVTRVEYLPGEPSGVFVDVEWRTPTSTVSGFNNPTDLRVVHSAGTPAASTVAAEPRLGRRERIMRRRKGMDLTPKETSDLLDRIAWLQPDQFTGWLDDIEEQRGGPDPLT